MWAYVQLTLDSHFTKDLGLDSLDQVECILAIEDELSTNCPRGAHVQALSCPTMLLRLCSRLATLSKPLCGHKLARDPCGPRATTTTTRTIAMPTISTIFAAPPC